MSITIKILLDRYILVTHVKQRLSKQNVSRETLKGGVGMDTVNIVLQAVTTVGFPIVCCGALMYYVKYMRDSDAEERQKMNEQHAQ